jgi:aspartyl-tRNA(Asn)/glutamyl-tRNA(Gln) amidotransferase subunit B
MRSKEEAHDYRYFPDPDLLPLELDPSWVEKIKAGLPELPDEKKHRLMRDFGLSIYDAGVMVSEPEIGVYFEEVAKGRDAKQASNWVTGSLFAALNAKGVSITESPVTAANLGKLIDLIGDNTISGRIAKDVFEIMVETGGDPAVIVEEKGLKQITDTGFIEGIVEKIIAENPGQVAQYDGGANPKVIGWFVGQVMKQSQGKANPAQVNELLKKKLG